MPLDTGLMAFWNNIDAAEETAVRQWHNCQHMSERVNIPGFRTGRRYRGFDDASTFLMYYETESPSVLAGEDYQRALNTPTQWTRDSLKFFKDPARAIFKLVDEAGVTPQEPAFFLATLRFNVSGEAETMRQAYLDRVLHQLAADPNVIRVCLWENELAITGIRTAESSIYGASAGQQQFALFVEARERPPLPTAGALPGLTEAERASHVDQIPEVGWLDFALR